MVKHRVTFHIVIAVFKVELDPLQVGCMHHGFRVKRYPIKKYFLSHCHMPCSFLGCGDKQFFFVVQSLSCVWLFVIPWTATRQASLSFTVSQSLLRFMSIGSVIPSNHLILCYPFLLLLSIFPNIRSFPMSVLFALGGQSIGAFLRGGIRSVLGVHWKHWCWSWNSNTLATWCEELTYLKRHCCWERLRAGGEGDDRMR